ncbi:MAG: hypothetical protein RIC55_28595 [Pirellulaceae bacterium]
MSAWVGVLVLGSLLLWAISWLRLPKPAALALWGSGYQQNLSVPHNVYGWESLSDLSTLAQHSQRFRWSGTWLRLEQEPTEVRSDSPWQTWFKQFEERTLVLSIALHGAADEQGAYLLYADTSETKDVGKLRIEALLQRLAKLPAEKKKLIILDATQVVSDWRLGILHNEFARGLAELNEQITAVPNLVVISSSDVNQRSWVCEDRRRTIFGYSLAESLQGAAKDTDHDGRIDAAELYDSVRGEVSQWARIHRAALQTPVLLPSGAVGRKRARSIDLGAAASRAKAHMPEFAPPFAPSEQLTTAWKKYEALSSQKPWGFSYAPTLWREYQAALIRYEELVRAGDNDASVLMLDRIRGLEFRITGDQTQNLSSLQNSLAMWAACGISDTHAQQALTTLNELWNASPADYSDMWQAAQKKVGGDPREADMLRIAVFEALLDRVIEDPAGNLSTAAAIVETVADPLRPRPAEIHFMLMLHRYLPAEALSEDGGQRIRTALDVRRMAERAAVGLQKNGSAFSEVVSPWIAETVEDGDRQRRMGEDLLFAAAAQRAGADEYFQAARRSYDLALDMALKLRNSLHVRDEVLERLPYYSRWLVCSMLDDYQIESSYDASYDATLGQVENLWNEVNQLEIQLERQNPHEIYNVPAPSADDRQPRSIVDQTQVVSMLYQQVVERYRDVTAALTTSPSAVDWREVRHALLVPPSDWRLRMKMLEEGRRRTRQQLLDDHRRRSNAAPLEASASSKVESVRADAAQQEQRVMRSAHWQGRLALAMLGRRVFEESSNPNWETYDQVRHRLDVFEVEQQWWKSLTAAGRQIQNRWNWMPNEIQAMVRRAPKADDKQSLASLRIADCLARRIDGAQAAALEVKPAVDYRRRRLHDLTLFQADRALGDRWYALDPHAEPYFRHAGLSYLADAQLLDPSSTATPAMRVRLINARGLEVAPLPLLDLTTQRRVEIEYQITSAKANGSGEEKASAAEAALEKIADNDAPPPLGFPVAWLDGDKSLQVLQPRQGERIVRKLGPENRVASVLCTIDSPVLDAAEKKLPHEQTVDHAAITLSGFFRGQLLSGRVPVDLHLLPETMNHRYPQRDGANVSLVASPQLHQELGDGSGAVAFVLDCSGSMGPPRGAESSATTKYREAAAALREVLSDLPAGVQVSVWLFGEAVGPDRTAIDPATTIRRVQPPIVWNPKDPGQMTSLMERIAPGRVTPWNQSPIVRTILAAKSDVLEASGFRTIVVITDGVDNSFENDPVANPKKQSITAALTEAFDDGGVSLNIIGFKVENGEEQLARRQFEIVETFFPPGKFYVVGQSAALASTLKAALGHRLRYWMESFDADSADSKQRRLLEVGNSGGGEYWFSEPLKPGTYDLRINADSQLRTEISLAPGDLLPLQLDRTSQGLSISRFDYARRRFPQRPSATADGWVGTVLNAQSLADQRVQMSLALERSPRADANRIQQVHPRQIWIEASPLHADQPPGALQWGPLPGYPMPTWSLLAAAWPVDDSGAAKRPQLRVWWNADQQTPLAGVLRRTAAHKSLDDLAGSVIRAVDQSVAVESVAVESHYVEVRPGVRAPQSCLVVRLQNAPGKVHWARVQGVDAAGVEHRFYPSIGRYTGLFWPVAESEALEQLRGIGVVSLDALKTDAQARGSVLDLRDIPAPQPGDVRPSPPLAAP